MKSTKFNAKKGEMFLGYTWDKHERVFVRVFLDYYSKDDLGLSYCECHPFVVNPKKFFLSSILYYCDTDKKELLRELQKYTFIDVKTIEEFCDASFWSFKDAEKKRKKTANFANAILRRFPRTKLEVAVRETPHFN